MGTDPDFIITEGAQAPELVARLSAIPKLDDPALMARLLDGMAGTVVDFESVGLAGALTNNRQAVFGAAKELRSKATEFKAMLLEHPNLDLGALQLAQLLSGGENPEVSSGKLDKAVRYIGAVETIAGFPLRNDLTGFVTPTADEGTARIVGAVLEYCTRKAIKPKGAPRSQTVGGEKVHIVKTGSVAELILQVLKCLDIPIEASELDTLISTATGRNAAAREKLNLRKIRA